MRSPWRIVAVLAALGVVAVLVAGRPTAGEDDEPFDPDGTGGDGARALVLLLEELGAEVTVDEGVPGADVDTAVALADTFDPDRAAGLLDWVDDGGTLVVADPSSPFTPIVTGPLGDLDELAADDIPSATCDVAELADVEQLAPGGGQLYEVPGGADSCFGDGDRAFVVAEARGAGRLVSVGGQGPFLNGGLGDGDAAVLAARLLVPGEGDRDVAFLVRDPSPPEATAPEGRPGEGDESLVDLVPDRVSLALAQLVIAFLAYVWFRSRRVGKPVPEPRPTTLAGSDLVAAVGRLRSQERDADRSAAVLRGDLHRTLCRRLGLPADTGVDDLVAVAERAGADPELLRAALEGRAVDDAALVTLARTIDQTRQEVLHEQP
jgi:hypothetical protein